MTNHVLYQGAEAILTKITYHGYPAVQKKRIPKAYRVPEIDTTLITYRTKEETKLISEARTAGVHVPLIYDVNPQQGSIIMEYIPGSRLKDILNTQITPTTKTLCQKIGTSIAKLHNNELIHGDLTTSNMILYNNNIYFIDFGLGSKTAELEAQGVDLHVLMEAFESTHSQQPHCFSWALDGYLKEAKQNAHDIKQKIQDIINRGRYR